MKQLIALADALAEPLLDPKYADRERNAVNAELTMASLPRWNAFWQVRAENLESGSSKLSFYGRKLRNIK